MRYSPTLTFSSSYLLGVWLHAGLRLLGTRQFQAFLPTSAYLLCGSSSYFGSSGCFRTLLTSARPNPAFKLTSLRQLAELIR